MKENIVTAVLKIEEEASNIVLDAKAKARQREEEISKIVHRLQKEFNKDAEELKAQIQKRQQEEEDKVKRTFEQKIKKIEKIDPQIGVEMVNLVLKKLSEV